MSGEEKPLSRFGYAEDLLRAMGGFSSFALSFSIISILTGITTTYGTAIAGGGPAALGIGWPLVSAGALVVALAMAELASAFPTAGALYHWSSLLGGAGWGWITAMTNLVGQCAIVAAIDLGCAQFVGSILGWPASSQWPLLFVILASHAWINVASVRLVAWFNDFSVVVHIVGVVVILGALIVFGRAHPLAYVTETGFTTRADGNYTLGFLNALVLGMWTFTGFDASAHASEETKNAETRAPWGIVSSVVVSAVAGYALVVALTLAIRDLPKIAADAHAAQSILEGALGERVGRATVGLATLAMWFCGLSSVTSFSRTLFAFARDRGLPGSTYLRIVGTKTRTPHVAILAATILPLVLTLSTATFGDAVFLTVASLATTALYASYAIPILLGAIARRRRLWTRRGPWHLGALGVPIAWCAVLWVAFVLFVCVLPPNALAGPMLLGVIVLIAVLYFAFVRGRFTGPKVNLAELERR